jgi:hypothetical protein
MFQIYFLLHFVICFEKIHVYTYLWTEGVNVKTFGSDAWGWFIFKILKIICVRELQLFFHIWFQQFGPLNMR